MAEVVTAVNSHFSGDSQSLKSLLSTEDRNYLVRNNGERVKVLGLDGNITALYFAASRSDYCEHFTQIFVEIYEEKACRGDFEAVFISSDTDEESFNQCFSKMPWLAIPFSDSATRDRVRKSLQVNEIPQVVILDGKGKLVRKNGVSIIGEYGADGYPFTKERIRELKEEEETAKKNQTLRSILVSGSRDFLISNDGNKVNVSLYMSYLWAFSLFTFSYPFTSLSRMAMGSISV